MGYLISGKYLPESSTAAASLYVYCSNLYCALLTVLPDYVDPGRVPSFFTSSAETERRLVIVKAIWDEKAKIATSDDSQQEYRPGLEEVQQIIREADAIIISSSHQTLLASQPPHLEPLFSSDEVDGGTERPIDNVSPQLPITDNQIRQLPVSEPSPYETSSALLTNSTFKDMLRIQRVL